jgi:hypothetical protein
MRKMNAQRDISDTNILIKSIRVSPASAHCPRGVPTRSLVSVLVCSRASSRSSLWALGLVLSGSSSSSEYGIRERNKLGFWSQLTYRMLASRFVATGSPTRMELREELPGSW